jgi:hypothetical protein
MKIKTGYVKDKIKEIWIWIKNPSFGKILPFSF